MRAGKLNKRVGLQQLTQTPDGAGGFTEEWATIATLWAEVAPVSAFERLQADQLRAGVSHRVTIRHRAGVTAKHRLQLGARTFQVQGVRNPDEANERLVLDCEEIEE